MTYQDIVNKIKEIVEEHLILQEFGRVVISMVESVFHFNILE